MYRFIINSFFIIALTATVSCTNKTENKNSSKKVFRYNESAGISSLDPAFAKDLSNIWAVNQLFNGLVQLNDSLIVKPCIAKNWSISTDGLIYKFNLRNDVFFHDHFLFKNGKGRKVIANDFVYSFNRIIDPKIASPGAWIFNNVNIITTNNLFNFKSLNDSTFIIALSKPFPPFLSLLAMQYCSVVPKEVVDYYQKDFRKHPVGTGPFYFKMWKEGVKLVMLKNPKYFEFIKDQRLPFLDAVAITFIVDKQSAFLEFLKGNLDFISGLDPGYKDELLSKSGKLRDKYKNKINLITQPYMNTEYLGILMDSTNPIIKNNPLKIKAIRQAINFGFDRIKMIRYLRNNIGVPGIYGIIPTGMPSFDSSEVIYDYQPDKALKLLSDAGYPNGAGLPEITLSTNSSYLDLCEFIQHQLSEIGIKIKIDVNPPATLREIIAKSKTPFFRASWIADYPDAENYLALFYSKNFSPQGPNYTHFSNIEYDGLYEKSLSEINDSVRYSYYKKMNLLIMNEAPVVILYYDQVLRFVQKNINGLGSNPMNLIHLKFVKKS